MSTPTDREDWSQFEDMVMTKDSIPLHGIRLLTMMDEDGNQWIEWRLTGEPTMDETSAMLTRVLFLSQMHEFVISQGIRKRGDDEDN